MSSDEPSLRVTGERRAKPYRWDRAFGILNPNGQFWTYRTFDSREGAYAHLAAFWRLPGFPKALSSPQALATFEIVPVRVTVSVSTRKDGSSLKPTSLPSEEKEETR